METQNTSEGKTMNTNSLNPHMEPVQISTGRFVGFGHEVVNFGWPVVVVGSRDLGPVNGGVMLIVRPVSSSGEMERDGWMAAPKFCK